ncbi:16S rRNA (cytosine(967)-C(5))-methyltransferase RsmB [Weissella koreensis]|uniref:16S rRNA (cytosine(967)-C(5))-methyltransferase n=1 Tax=Weissella koreensis TaxID=165096 RepID=A0A7H1MK90_9LACO|nr:16S rRNA (cytosine(967)-C(5))-methyltransferase RsmB [Weissella koreensis]AEJ23016.1 16S rRNA methyltransferase B [Weissella koreensis KACC 15510]AVH74618.1 16S rRNA (cytosine(967)-C(5))-methyltransferase RsmB [Weissella koreensis]EJF33968.1 RNA methyltransferase [Weissella koreensis KCTC 3621]EJF34258.1 RNA methyltransferase [Weissella koreensis KCTC 3621]QGN19842.1 16S rRNA (cytosine(967)-C(5))-methyltransferase RsmB [Weissella koreensis]
MSKGNSKQIAGWEQSNARALSVRVLERVKDGAYSNLQLNQLAKASKLEERDIHLLTTIVYGVIQHRLTLEYWLKPFLRGNVDPFVKELLMISVYQMQYLDKIPQHAIFDEAIQIAKRRGHDGIRKYVTGVLHSLERQGLPEFTTIKDPIEQLSIEASLPVWLLKQLESEVGHEKMVKIARSINDAPAQSARINRAVTTQEQVTTVLEAEGFEVEASKVTPEALRIKHGHVASSKAFEDGLLTLQDESAMLMVPNLNLTPSMKVLDAAAAPGGKTTQIASYLDPKQGGIVEALDIHPHKIKLIEENAQRLHVSDQVHAQELDARKVDEQFDDETFDAILVDAPCSGFGLLRRKPEIRYEKSYADSMKLHQIQLDMLNAVAPKLKKGGNLVYGTCTILEIENDAVVQDFLEQNSDYELVPTIGPLPQRSQLTMQVFPDDFDSDGFFVATLRKKK